MRRILNFYLQISFTMEHGAFIKRFVISHQERLKIKCQFGESSIYTGKIKNLLLIKIAFFILLV